MRLLVDNNLSRTVAEFLRPAGQGFVRVRDIKMQAALDNVVLEIARWDCRALIHPSGIDDSPRVHQ